jgi:hypothetical protein
MFITEALLMAIQTDHRVATIADAGKIQHPVAQCFSLSGRFQNISALILPAATIKLGGG